MVTNNNVTVNRQLSRQDLKALSLCETIDRVLSDSTRYNALKELLGIYNKWQDEELEGLCRIYNLYDKKDVIDIIEIMCDGDVAKFYCIAAPRTHWQWVRFKGDKVFNLNKADVTKLIGDMSINIAQYIVDNDYFDLCPELTLEFERDRKRKEKNGQD